MTNREFLASCSKEELALSLLSMISNAIEDVTKKKIPENLLNEEYSSILRWLDMEFLKPSKYVS